MKNHNNWIFYDQVFRDINSIDYISQKNLGKENFSNLFTFEKLLNINKMFDFSFLFFYRFGSHMCFILKFCLC